MSRYMVVYSDVGWTALALIIFFVSFASIVFISFLSSSQKRFEMEKWLPLENSGSTPSEKESAP